MKNIAFLLPLLYSISMTTIAQTNDLSPAELANYTLNCLSADEDGNRELEKMKACFTEDARLGFVEQTKEGLRFRQFSISDFVTIITKQGKEGAFTETQLEVITNEYNGMAQVFQSYEVRFGDQSEQGINSYQMVQLEEGWKIVSIVWSNDRNGVPVPEFD